MDPGHADLQVALLAEGVDRNCTSVVASCQTGASPSSRRAWIEIFWALTLARRPSVALLAEGVDRNLPMAAVLMALSAVALLAEGVDRNRFTSMKCYRVTRRPPRGGRG